MNLRQKAIDYVEAPENNIHHWDSLTYKLACLYMGMTEIHDRALTDLRSSYDLTEAFILSDVRSASNRYAKELINHISKVYGITSKDLTKEIQSHHNYSAQKWISEYERLWRA